MYYIFQKFVPSFKMHLLKMCMHKIQKPRNSGIVYKRTPLTKKSPPCLCTRLLRTNPKMKLFSRNGGTTPLSSSSSSNSPNAKFSTSNGLEKQRRPSKSSRPSTLKKKKENNYYASNDLILPTGKF